MASSVSEEAVPLEELRGIAATTKRVFGGEKAGRVLRVSEEQLTRLEQGDLAVFDSDPTLGRRLLSWAQTNGYQLFPASGRPEPPFDYFQDFWDNFYEGPPENGTLAPHNLEVRRTRLFDHSLNFPLGVPACALTPHSGYITYFARRGFDLITYKTVRDRAWNPHPYPQWAFAVDPPGQIIPEEFDHFLHATFEIPHAEDEDVSLVNSFGVPSLPPADWQQDITHSKAQLAPGQVLIVSVMGSPEEAADIGELASQFSRTAALASEAGADIVEVNLSCPNTGSGDLICSSPADSEEVVSSVAKELRTKGVPLLAKISYLKTPELTNMVSSCAPYIQGVVAINTVSVPVVGRDGKPFFGKRSRAGLSGSSIRTIGLTVCRDLVSIRSKMKRLDDFAVIAVGGVVSPRDFDEYMGIGVDAVQTCSGAWLDPGLAIRIRGGEWSLTSQDTAFLRSFDRVFAEERGVDVAVRARLTPSEVRVATERLSDMGLLQAGHSGLLKLTIKGQEVARMIREGRAANIAPPRGIGPSSEEVDEQLQEEIARLEA